MRLLGWSMTGARVRRGRVRARARSLGLGLPVLAVAGALLFLLPLAGVASAATAWDPTPRSWTNGTVLCEFAPTLPSVSVSALSRAGTGLTASVVSVAEVSPQGSAVANANLSAAPWTGANDSTEDAYDLAYSLEANVTASGAPARVVGTVDLRVDYVLPAYEESGAGSSNAVAVDLQVVGWPWQSTSDHLVISLVAQPSFAGEERIVLGGSGGPLLTSVSTAKGTAFEQMAGSSEAFVTAPSGARTTIPATPSVAGNATAATVSIAFGSAAGEFSALNYSASVTVLLPATVVGIPTIDLVAVGGAAAVISVLVAVAVRRARARPSDLTFVESEEP